MGADKSLATRPSWPLKCFMRLSRSDPSRSSARPQTQGSDYSTSSSSISSPAMSPQVSWTRSLPGGSDLDHHPHASAAPTRTSYFPTMPASSQHSTNTPYGSSGSSSYVTTPGSDCASDAGYTRRSWETPSNSSLPSSYFPSSATSSPSLTARSGMSYTLHPPPQPQTQQGVRPQSSAHPSKSSFTKDLIARSAAAIPPPPSLTMNQSRTCSGPTSSFALNSTNTVVYSHTALRNNAVGLSVGLVRLSPLASCGKDQCGGCANGGCENGGR